MKLLGVCLRSSSNRAPSASWTMSRGSTGQRDRPEGLFGRRERTRPARRGRDGQRCGNQGQGARCRLETRVETLDQDVRFAMRAFLSSPSSPSRHCSPLRSARRDVRPLQRRARRHLSRCLSRARAHRRGVGNHRSGTATSSRPPTFSSGASAVNRSTIRDCRARGAWR